MLRLSVFLFFYLKVAVKLFYSFKWLNFCKRFFFKYNDALVFAQQRSFITQHTHNKHTMERSLIAVICITFTLLLLIIVLHDYWEEDERELFLT